MTIIKETLILAATLILCLNIHTNAREIYSIKMDMREYAINKYLDYDRISSDKINDIPPVGHPEIPIVNLRYYISSVARPLDVNVVRVTKELVKGEYNIFPSQVEPKQGNQKIFCDPDSIIYCSTHPYPERPIQIGPIGFKRGHQLANILVYPFEYVPATKELYFYSSIEFEFIYDSLDQADTQNKRMDVATIETIKRMVENDNDAPMVFGNPITAKTTHSLTIDSIPCVIITDLQMQPAFEEYAWWKTIRGTRTEVMRVDVIDMLYPGDSLQNKIRNFIKDYYETKFTEWVILGGDVDIIPAIHANANSRVLLTDLYYSNLDSSWNEDGDSLFGECEWSGDYVDYYAEVYVGRVPCNTLGEAQTTIEKLITYQSDTLYADYQQEALFLSSNMFYNGDGSKYCQDLIDCLPLEYDTATCDSCTTDDVYNALNNRPGLIVNYSHSQHPDNFVTRYHIGISTEYVFNASNFDSMNTDNRYSIFLNSTCYSAALDTIGYEVMGRNFILSPNGGGVGYIGSTNLNYSSRFRYMHRYLFGLLFDSCQTNLGKTLTLAKEACWIPSVNHTDTPLRSGLFSYMYLGDPQLEMWTTQPKKLRLYLSVDTVMAESTANISILVADENDEAVSGALICLTKGYDGVYELTYTGDYGEAAFDNIYFPAAGTATVVVSKPNYFPVEDSIEVISGGGGCPMLYVYNGTDYQFVNNILAQSEDFNLPLGNYTDYYPIYSVPLLDDNSIKVRIQEGGKEKSYIDQLAVNYIYYPIDKQVAYTNKNEFKYISSNYLLPISAVNDNGKDVLDQITAFDELHYSSTLPGNIIVKYKCPDGIGKVSSEGGGGIEPPPGGKGSSKVLADDVLDRNVVVSILDESGNWQAIDTHYPRVMKTGRFTDLSDYWSGSELTVKIEWNSDIAIDCLPYYFFESDIIAQNEVSLSSLVHNINGDLSAEAEAADDNELTLSPGEYINFEFDGIPYLRQHRIAAVLKAVGRYEQITDDGTSDDGFTFDQNYPNPFNPATTFSFSLPVNTDVNLSIFNILGQKVAEIVNGNMAAGRHEVFWDGFNTQGQLTASGIYFAKFKAGEYTNTKKIMIVK